MSHPCLPDKALCSGCRLCGDVCPKSAIIMKADQHGFFYPEINTDLCVGCGRCDKLCAVLNIPNAYTDVRRAAVGENRDKEVLSRSASGGAFTAVVSAWKPDAVCGVRWESFEAVNDIAFSEENIEKFSKSKYILSDSNDIFRRAAEEVKTGKRVIFSGTPCQIAAFRNYIDDVEHHNLLLVDIVCHGAPSSRLFQMHLNELEKSTGKKIIKWSFRDKTPIKGMVSSRSARVDYEDGTWEHFEIKQDVYLKLYYERVAYRKACENCPFAKPERLSDITVCDAHHINEIYPDMTVEEGASTILFHTEKGLQLLPELHQFMDLRDVEYDWVVNHNQQLARPTTIHPKTDEFYRLIDSGVSFEKAVMIATHRSFASRAMGKMKRILRGN